LLALYLLVPLPITPFFIATVNGSDPNVPFLLLSFNAITSNIDWMYDLTPVCSYDGSGTALAYSPEANAVMIVSGSSSRCSNVLTIESNGSTSVTTTSGWDWGSSPYQQATFYPPLQEIWLLTDSSIYANVIYQSEKVNIQVPYEIVTIAWDSVSGNFFGLSNAAQDTLLYSWTFSLQFTLVGLIPNSHVVPYSMTTIDSKNEVITFVSTVTPSNTIITVFLSNASIVSISPLLPFNLITFSYPQYT